MLSPTPASSFPSSHVSKDKGAAWEFLRLPSGFGLFWTTDISAEDRSSGGDDIKQPREMIREISNFARDDSVF